QSMRRACLLVVVVIAIFLVLSRRADATDSANAGRPNVLFCFADDWGWPHAGAYGDSVVKTAAFDRLAKEGVLFEHAFISSPSCTPSRNALLTGQQFFRLGPGANLYGALDVKHPTFVRLLEQAGYETGHWRKAWGPGDFRQGGYESHPCGEPQSFKDFMKSRDSGKPFCFWFGTSDPHRGYKKGSGRKSGMDIDRVHVPDFYPNVEDIRSDIADYYFEVERWNRDVLQAIQLLEESGELENTVIAMSGDHGMPFPRCKGNLYDWGSRVPLAIRWGSGVKKPGRTVTDFVSTTDLAPTFLEAAGITVPDSMTGRSLLSILQSEKDGRVESDRDAVVYGRERHTDCQQDNDDGYPSRAIRTDEYLYIRNFAPDRWPAGTPHFQTAYKKNAWLGDCDNGPTKFYLWINRDADSTMKQFYELNFGKRPAEELYIIANDPDQVTNVADRPEYATIKKKIADRLSAALIELEDPREVAAEVQFDDYPYSGGVPKYPGDKAVESYRHKR
ncbi:MAG: sulfatase, partial [Planctomycetota bacterium]